MAEITAEAYQDLRQYILDNWHFIELQNDSGTAVVRLSPNDSRVSWVHEMIEGEAEIITWDQLGTPIYGDPVELLPNTLQLQIVITGADSEVSLPTTFTTSAIYKVDADGEPFSTESFEPFTMQNDQDELTVIHNIEVPQL